MSNDCQACPFLCELRDLEIGMESQVIGYLCKAQCKDCPAHNNTVNELTAEIERLKRKLKNFKCHLTALRDSLLLTVNDEVDLERSFAAEQRVYLYNGLIELINAADNNVLTKESEGKE